MKNLNVTLLSLIMVALTFVSRGEVKIQAGDPVSKLIDTLGPPTGTATMSDHTLYLYDGGTISVKDGKVGSSRNCVF